MPETKRAKVIEVDFVARRRVQPGVPRHLLTTAAQTLYVGDDARDVTAARAAGMPVVVAAYGYLGDGDPPSLWGADAILESPDAVLQWMVDQGLTQKAA